MGMTECELESVKSMTAGTDNAGDTKEAHVTLAMTDTATRTDIGTPPVTMANDGGLGSAAEQKEAVRVTDEASVGVSADLTKETTRKETAEATVGAMTRAIADMTPGVAQKHATPSPKTIANKSTKEVKQARSVSKAQVQK